MGGRSSFSYTGTVSSGTEIFFGNGGHVTVTGAQYNALRKHFLKRIVSVGTSRTDHEEDSIGRWLKENVCSVAIASYVAALLIEEQYAERREKYHIRVLR